MAIFVIHKHFSKTPHWDLRLEMDGVLKSWAMPKEPMMNVRRLAIQVDDHELSYADFEGEIPKGQYGAGVVKIWDEGEYKLNDRTDFKLEFNLKGKKLIGDFILVQMKERQWLLFHK